MPNIDGQVYFQGEMIPYLLYNHIKEDLCVLQVQDALALGEEVLAPFLSSRCERVGAKGAAFWVACPGFSGSVSVRDAAGEERGTFSRCTDLPGGTGEIATIALDALPFPVPCNTLSHESHTVPLQYDGDGGRVENMTSSARAPQKEGSETLRSPPTPQSVIEEALTRYPIHLKVPPVSEPEPATEGQYHMLRDDVIDRTDKAGLIAWLRSLVEEDQGGIVFQVPEGLDQMSLEQVQEVARQVSVSPEAQAWHQAEEERKARMEDSHRYDVFRIVDDRGGVRMDHAAVGRYIRDRLHALTYHRTLYVYDEETGLYHEDEGQVDELVQEIAEAIGYTKTITTAKREVMSYVRDHRIVTEYPFNTFPGIPVANGVVTVDFETGDVSLQPYTPEMGYTYRLPVVYDPLADSTPIDQILESWVERDDVLTLYQIPAQAILHQLGRRKPYKKCYILHGDQDAGKTTYLELLYCTVGTENCADVALQRIGTDRFYKGALEGKVFNICDDLGDVPFSNTGPLKALTGGFEHDIEKKGRDSYKGRIFAVHVFTCNKPPQVDDRNRSDSAFWGRWEYTTFPNSFPKDPGFHERTFTSKNISGFFNRVLWTAIAIVQNGGLLVDSSAYVVRERWSYNADPIYRFIQENMYPDPKGAISTGDFYEGFLQFCQAEKIDQIQIPASEDAFGRKLFSYDVGKSRPEIDGVRKWVYTGYQWSPQSPYKPIGGRA